MVYPHGCCWETFCILLIVGQWLKSNHLAAKIEFVAPLPTSTKMGASSFLSITRVFGSAPVSLFKSFPGKNTSDTSIA